MSNWNPDLYLKYQDERTQPALDLAARIELERPASLIDLGCGPGNSTRVLCRRWPQARVLGLDNSREMIEKAKASGLEASWILADLACWRDSEHYDLMFSNAALQWVPGHAELVPRLFDRVAPGGALAVQVPANRTSPLHQALIRTASRPEWADQVAGCAGQITYHDPGFYYDLLAPLAGRVLLWQTTYLHLLPDHHGLIEWYASTGMKTYLARLADEPARCRFAGLVLEECRTDYPVQADGKVLFPFCRTFFIAYRSN